MTTEKSAALMLSHFDTMTRLASTTFSTLRPVTRYDRGSHYVTAVGTMTAGRSTHGTVPLHNNLEQMKGKGSKRGCC